MFLHLTCTIGARTIDAGSAQPALQLIHRKWDVLGVPRVEDPDLQYSDTAVQQGTGCSGQQKHCGLWKQATAFFQTTTYHPRHAAGPDAHPYTNMVLTAHMLKNDVTDHKAGNGVQRRSGQAAQCNAKTS